VMASATTRWAGDRSGVYPAPIRPRV